MTKKDIKDALAVSDAKLGGAIKKKLGTAAIEAPAQGFVVVNATWYFAGTGGSKAICYLFDEADKADGPSVLAVSNGQATYRAPASLSRVFQVPSGFNIFFLNCADTNTGMKVFDISLNALYVPNLYRPEN